MKYPILLVSLLAYQTVSATELDFIYPSQEDEINKSMLVECAIDNNSLFTGDSLERIIRFNIVDLLEGESDGKHEIACEVSAQIADEDYSNNSLIHDVNYTIEFDAIKFKLGEESSFGSNAPIYHDGYGYGIAPRYPNSYLLGELVYDEECLTAYYGDDEFYLKALAGPMDVQWHYGPYATSVGVFIEPNPRVLP